MNNRKCAIRRTRRLERGTAMTEFVLALPMFLTVLALSLYMGWSMMRKQHVEMATRYTVWMAAEGQAAQDVELNSKFLSAAAGGVKQTPLPASAEGVKEWAGQSNALGYELLSGWRGGAQIRVQADYPTNVPYWQQFAGPIEARKSREGREWTHDEVYEWKVLENAYCTQLDSSLMAGSGDSAELVDTIRGLYSISW